jgi:hypothetical protein
MPQARLVILNYDPANTAVPFGPSPRQVAVGPNDTIQFRIGASTRAAHADCKLRITLHTGQHFSRGVLQHSPAQTGAEDLVLTVLPGLAAGLPAILAQPNHIITGFKCELLHGNGQPIPGLASDGASGGEIIPDSSGS